MDEQSQPLHASPDCEIVSTRVLNIPRDTVFRAWTNPEQLKVWWGPKGFTNTFHEFDLQPGGNWRFIMHGPEGGNYVNECVFEKITPPELIAWNRISPPIFRVVAAFEEQSGNTLVTFKMIFSSAKECDKIKKIAVPANEENFDRLEAMLNWNAQ